MTYNKFKTRKSEYEYLLDDYPGLKTLSIGGARIVSILDTWDTVSIATIERLAYVEWRILDEVFRLFRERIGVEAMIGLQQLRQAWRLLWLASIRQLVSQTPKRTLRFVDGGAELLDQLESDFRTTTRVLSADTWIDYGRKMILSLRESDLGANL